MTGDVARRVSRIGLGFLAVTSIPLGVWAVLSPRSFYRDFPGFGAQWVKPDGPFNEHLVRDFGALNLAIATFTVAAAISLTRPVVIGAALAWIVWPVPHLVYHSLNLHHWDAADQVGIVVGILGGPVVAVVLLVAARSLPARA